MRKNGNKKNDAHTRPDFSAGERGKFFRLQDSKVMIPLDVDIVRHYQKLARKEKKAYYVLINEALRDAMQEQRPEQDFAKLLRKMVVREIKKSAPRH